MVAQVIAYMIAISMGVLIAWSWVAFISQAISRRRGSARAVPYPQDVLWTLTGRTLLDLGLFGGAPVWVQRPQQRLRCQAAADYTAKMGRGGASKHRHGWKKGAKPVLHGFSVQG